MFSKFDPVEATRFGVALREARVAVRERQADLGLVIALPPNMAAPGRGGPRVKLA
jgi:hypothetical protein